MGIESKIRALIANPSNYGNGRPTSSIKYLVYHYTGNDGDTASANAQYYRDTLVKASAHYFVDDKEIVQSVADSYVAWAVGGKKWSDCAQTGGGTLYGVVTNANSLSIEMCDVARDGKLMASEATLDNAVALGKMLMRKYSIPLDHVVRHFDVTGKYCPAYFMDADAWEAFKARLAEKEDEMDIDRLIAQMTPEQAYKIYTKATDYMNMLPLPVNWNAAGELRGAVELGITTDGSNPNAPIPRYQAAIMAKRAYEKAKRDILSELK